MLGDHVRIFSPSRAPVWCRPGYRNLGGGITRREAIGGGLQFNTERRILFEARRAEVQG